MGSSSPEKWTRPYSMTSQYSVHSDQGVSDQQSSVTQSGSTAVPTICAIERVFPIRVQHPQKQASNATPRVPSTHTSPAKSFNNTAPAAPQCLDAYVSVADPIPKHDAVEPVRLSSGSLPSVNRYVTNRFGFHPAGNSNGPPKFSVATPSEKIYRCEDEPIHIPGAIQSFGALIALKANDHGHFIVRIVSENSKSVTGLEPEGLFGLSCFTDVLSQSDKKEFLLRIGSLSKHASMTTPDVFVLSIASSLGDPVHLFCAVHLSKESNLIICEFEVAQDIFKPTHPPNDGFPDVPVGILDHHDVDPAQYLASTTSKSNLLHAVEIARSSSRRLDSMDLFHVLCEIQAQMATTTVLSELLDIIVGLVYELTSFHRVMVYQFDETSSGSVISEFIDTRASTDLYRGLHFPSYDIPKQARELYALNTIRILYDRYQETARLVCRDFEDSKTPLDLKHSYLRAMSPIHLKYLANMGVQASMSISLMVHGKLWGLVSCHNYGNGLRVALPLRELCQGLGQIASSHIERVLYASRIRARKILSNEPPKISPTAYVAASSSDLLSMFEADLGFLVIKGEARTIGKLLAYSECIALLGYIRQRALPSIFSSNAIQRDCKDIVFPPGDLVINGLLIIPLAHSGADFLVFFRKSKQKEIQWAGNPYEKKVSASGDYLEPRSSFNRWSEIVVGTSREWTEDQVESATVLSTLYGRFIEVWRQKEAIVQRNRMTRVLIRNAGHEVRTPLNSVINYLEMALEESLDEGARQHLQKSLQASKSLVFVVNDLLSLTEAEEIEFDVHEDNVALTSIIAEAIAAFKPEAIRRGVDVILEGDYSIPSLIRCDPEGLRQVLYNLLANAIRNSDGGTIRIRLEHLGTTDLSSMIQISIQDEGSGLSESELDGIFQDFEKVLDDDESKTRDPSKTTMKTSTKAAEIGLGLALTARFVRHNFGQIKLSSEGKGKGTLVSISIPFRKALQAEPRRPSLSTIREFLPTPPSDHLLALNLPITISAFDTSGPQQSIPTPSDPQSAEPLSPEPLAMASPSIIGRFPFPNSAIHQVPKHFNILVAEDNPLNSRLLEARLSRKGHGIRMTIDGRDCLDALKSSPEAFDIILMDIQMPVIDGIEATRLIRSFEKQSNPALSQLASNYGRIPIIAVSASLSEPNRNSYIDVGFDGWIVKPIDFKRLEKLIVAIEDAEVRESMLYGNQSWERGGWFHLKGKQDLDV